MAVVAASRRWSARSMEIGRGGVIDLSEIYDLLIEPETGVDPRQMIRNALGTTVDGTAIPARGLEHPEMGGLYCRTLSVAPNGGPTAWTLQPTYSNSQGVNQSDDPTLAPPEILFGGVEENVEIDTDLDGNPVATTVGEPFEPGLIVPRADVSLSYAFNAPATTVNIPWLLGYANKVNSDAWNGSLPGEALINGTPQARYVYGTDELPPYYAISLQILIRKNSGEAGAPPMNAWRRRVLNQGFRVLDADGKLVVAADSKGTPLNKPVLIDALGKATTTPYWRWFRVLDAVPFAPLGVVLP